MYVTVAVRALESFPASEKAVRVEIQTGFGKQVFKHHFKYLYVFVGDYIPDIGVIYQV